ncbi:hypothetical protein roselon_01637 [Roseibacterium elongatum DSM 19469]|uniref:Amine oxidase domain-containing protein n=1 Tax=Roseicyclus elongatus DSM 19469 TaxID=1294273 RepID=W8S5C7_9RHOB|nr:FAD-dependent oxidoreductase [Roseibacterium elongatum]AHM04016.1 hypothetical protein roselon_01637 [Roseibacterium elongatum DSM 19469]
MASGRAPLRDAPEFALDLAALETGQGALIHLYPDAPRRSLSGALGAVIGAQVETVFWHDWVADPLSLGGCSRAVPGAGGARLAAMDPVGERIFFAGKAAPGPLATTVGGACLSGQRAARTIAALL